MGQTRDQDGFQLHGESRWNWIVTIKETTMKGRSVGCLFRNRSNLNWALFCNEKQRLRRNDGSAILSWKGCINLDGQTTRFRFKTQTYLNSNEIEKTCCDGSVWGCNRLSVREAAARSSFDQSLLFNECARNSLVIQQPYKLQSCSRARTHWGKHGWRGKRVGSAACHQSILH